MVAQLPRAIENSAPVALSSNCYETLRITGGSLRIVPGRFAPSVDRDYYVSILQIRRYLYGDLSESKLIRYLAQVTPRIRYRGLLSFYPIVDDDDLLKSLDGWLLHTISCAMSRRTALLTAAGHQNLPVPHYLKGDDLLAVRTATTSRGVELDLRIPSFLRMSKLLRKASRSHGPNAVSNAISVNYDSSFRRPDRYR